MQDSYPVRLTQPEIVGYPVRMVGTGASAPTLEVGDDITISRTGAGAYTLTWGEAPGTFHCMTHSLRAATPGDMAGHTLIGDTFASSALPIVLYDSAFAADDLEANEYIDLIVWFKRTAI